jgi:hypothetical protein
MSKCLNSSFGDNSRKLSDLLMVGRVRVFNATFNNISVLLEEETRVPRENH